MMYLAADHRGFRLKKHLKAFLTKRKFTVFDLGARDFVQTDDYPAYGIRAARAVVNNTNALGILICGSGVGIAAAANKIRGARAGCIASAAQAKAARRDDHLNLLVLAADFLTTHEAERIVAAFLATKPGNAPRYLRRVRALNRYGTKP